MPRTHTRTRWWCIRVLWGWLCIHVMWGWWCIPVLWDRWCMRVLWGWWCICVLWGCWYIRVLWGWWCICVLHTHTHTHIHTYTHTFKKIFFYRAKDIRANKQVSLGLKCSFTIFKARFLPRLPMMSITSILACSITEIDKQPCVVPGFNHVVLTG